MNRIALFIVLFSVLLIFRISAPYDILDDSQPKQVSYCMDILKYGHWLVQYEADGHIATKPPLYNWIASALCFTLNSHELWVIKLPSLFAGIGLLIIIYLLAKFWCNSDVAWYSVLVCLTLHIFGKYVWYARTDMLMTFLLYLAIYLTIVIPKNWYKSLLIGMVLALSALAKGPVGPIFFIAFGIAWLSAYQQWKSKQIWYSMMPGTILFFFITSLWLFFVWSNQQFHTEVLQQEVMGRVWRTIRGPIHFYYIIGQSFSQFLHWPIIILVGWNPYLKNYYAQPLKKLWLLTLIYSAIFLVLIPVHRPHYLLPLTPLICCMSGCILERLIHSNTNTSLDKDIFSKTQLAFGLKLKLTISKFFIFLTNKPAVSFLIFLCSTANFFSISAIVAVIVYSFISSTEFTAFVIICSIAILGLLTILARHHRNLAFILVGLGLILINCFYFIVLETNHDSYLPVQNFAQQARLHIQQDSYWVWKTNPMIFYEFDVHPGIKHNIQELQNDQPKWVITTSYAVDEMRQTTGCYAEETLSLVYTKEKHYIHATLYRTIWPQRN